MFFCWFGMFLQIIQRFRNDLIFSNKVIFEHHLVDLIKLTSSKWFIIRRPGQSCSFYEWVTTHLLCCHL